MTLQLIPTGDAALDPIVTTWWRGLIGTALEQQIRGLGWHFERSDGEVVATGYVTVSLLHEAPAIRRSWADLLNLPADGGGYAGRSGPLVIRIPDAIDPDEHCDQCGLPFDPRSNDRSRYHSGDTCRSCALTI